MKNGHIVKEIQRQRKHEELQKRFVGLSEDEARKKHNGELRVVEEDGEAFIITCDLHLDRLNLYIKDGLVYKVDLG